MSREKYQKDCPGCSPVIMDPETGKVNEKLTRYAVKFWETVSEADKLAFHAVCCSNSRDQGDVSRMQSLSKRLGEAIASMDKE